MKNSEGVIDARKDERPTVDPTKSTDSAFTDYYRCPQDVVHFENANRLGGAKGFFLCDTALGYGRCQGQIAQRPEQAVEIGVERNSGVLPFDINEVVDNLRLERYVEDLEPLRKRWLHSSWVNRAYYSLRPMLPVAVRRHLQKSHLSGWKGITFPAWPIDTTVDNLMQAVMRMALRQNQNGEIPFIWFWPDGYPACALVTHDVEQEAGRAFALDLLSIDDSFGIKSSFQVVPEGRYDSASRLVADIQDRGFEVNVHDFNHDGLLFKDRDLFVRRVKKINEYGESYGSKGFRSGSMYRRADWICELDFLYDMSVPNAAHLEPQHGGCCTVMPYKIGNLVELPLTLTQDYSLFHIVGRYSTELWEQEIAYLIRKHGLVNLIVHPDYVIEERELSLYRDLLKHLVKLRDQKNLWVPTPGEAARWWDARSRMTLEPDNESWIVRGEGSDRAIVAFACLEDGQLVYRIGQERRIASSETTCVLKWT